ncbi:MAG: hypothetical protein F6J90_15775 [Moorea sp. SIOASIH]|uniref:hypothetical protein n=1 Tax=Moorena sp. SIOASIH TaxID=2607817 RepID=UPI0013BB24F2|nr:hypothetical protein [Moorena sp. SIOASIH]NEO37707.1 hypothetical protein [Moorena sp. SIOASIH]
MRSPHLPISPSPHLPISPSPHPPDSRFPIPDSLFPVPYFLQHDADRVPVYPTPGLRRFRG